MSDLSHAITRLRSIVATLIIGCVEHFGHMETQRFLRYALAFLRCREGIRQKGPVHGDREGAYADRTQLLLMFSQSET